MTRPPVESVEPFSPRARQNGYQHFFWWNPAVIARLCAHALEQGLEVGYVRELATKRLGLIRRGIHLRDDLFVPPGGAGVQLSLL